MLFDYFGGKDTKNRNMKEKKGEKMYTKVGRRLHMGVIANTPDYMIHRQSAFSLKMSKVMSGGMRELSGKGW